MMTCSVKSAPLETDFNVIELPANEEVLLEAEVENHRTTSVITTIGKGHKYSRVKKMKFRSPLPRRGVYHVMTMSGNTSPTPHSQQGTSIPTSGYSELPTAEDGKISTSCSSPAKSSSPEVEVIEEAVPIIRTSLPTPEPKPVIERNGGINHQASTSTAHQNSTHLQPRLNGKTLPQDHTDYAIKARPPPIRDVDEDSCLIKCVYFTQQCCECVIM